MKDKDKRISAGGTIKSFLFDYLRLFFFRRLPQRL